MSDDVHSSLRSVHSNSQSDAALDLKTLDAESSLHRRSSLPPSVSSFGCSQCPKSFNRRENLSRHMKTHDVPRTHICQICEKTFTRSDLLRRHEAGHQRWDKRESKSEGRRGSVKRRKISGDSEEKNFSWTPTTQAESAHFSPSSCDPSSQMASASYSDSFHDSMGIEMPLLDDNQNRNLENNHGGWISSETAPRSFVEGQLLDISNDTSQQMPAFTIPHHESSSFIQQYQEPYQDISSNYQSSKISRTMEYPGHVQFSRDSYLPPESDDAVETEWFSNDFYAAMLDTGNEWGHAGNIFSQSLSALNQVSGMPSNIKSETSVMTSTATACKSGLDFCQHTIDTSKSPLERSAGIGHVSSPANMRWDQDKWPCIQCPPSNSPTMLDSDPVIITYDDILSQSHNPRYDISESNYFSLRDFLTPPANEVHQRKLVFTMPSSHVVNIFIGLYFKHFSHQVPVLHHPTVDTNRLCPSLLSAMMIIGATYSNIKNGRRFAIVLIEVIGWHLLAAMNQDVTLIRDPMMIFTQALLIHTGLWCGNKRAFNVAEAFRGHVITHMRHLYESEKWNTPSESVSIDEALEDPQDQWKSWVDKETLKRLYWALYTTDRQFSALWNQSSTIAIGELVDLGCPCDEALWIAPTAREWRIALGSAEIPQCPSFAAAIGPFLFSLTPPSSLSTGTFSLGEKLLQPQHFPLPTLNTYTTFLVLLEIQHQIFDFSQECLLASKFLNSQDLPQNHGSSPEKQSPHYQPAISPSQALKYRILARRQELAYSLNLFSEKYLQPHLSTSQIFHHISVVQHHLTSLSLHIPFTDLLNSIGKSGPKGIVPALQKLRLWAREDPELAVDVAVRAAEAIMEMNRGIDGANLSGQDIGSASTSSMEEMRGGMIDTGAYGATLLMMAHVILWVFEQVASSSQKQNLMSRLRTHKFAADSPFLNILENELAVNVDAGGNQQDFIRNDKGKGREGSETRKPAPRALFRSAAETLMKFGTWGVALDIALLLHLRAGG